LLSFVTSFLCIIYVEEKNILGKNGKP